jgi:signal transduction histidine kinase
VPPDEREAIFGFLHRGRTEAPGSGVGLALVRALVERAGGNVACTASPSGGARFTIALPLASDVAPVVLRGTP